MGPPASPTEAIERTLALMDPARRPKEPDVEHGYVDLLGERGVAGYFPGQRLMENPLLARIYERAWRPVGGRIFMGAFGPDTRNERVIALEMLDISPGHTVLDLGCGPGNFTREFGAELGDSGLAVGLDASSSMLARAVDETSTENIAYLRGDAADLPFSDAGFDGVCCFAALYFIEKPFQALDEIVRVLRPGGRVALLSSASRGPLPASLANAVVRPLTGVRMFGQQELTNALRERGMREVAQRVTGLAQFVSGRKG